MRDDLRYIPIGPNECAHCPGIKHWPWECQYQPEARELARKQMAEILRSIAKINRAPELPMPEPLVFRLRKRAEIRRQISTRKSVQDGEPDRLADLLDEAAARIEKLESAIDDHQR